MVLVTVATPLKPTEDPAQVKVAILRFFPDLDVDVNPDRISGTTRDLRPLRARVWELKIIDTFRGQFLHGTPTGAARSTRFRLSKQAAHAGKVSFPPTPHGLGDLELTVALEEGDAFADIDALAYWMCPETKDGEIVGAVAP